MDTMMSVLKMALVAMSLLSIAQSQSVKQSKHSAFCLFGIALFMTGMELATDSETPWQFLFFDAQVSDLNNAILGGVGMFALPLMFYAVVGKSNPESRSHTQR